MPRSSCIPNGSPSPDRPRVKSKIIKTYHHDISVSYDSLLSRAELSKDDSDPDETSKVMTSILTDMSPSASYSRSTNKYSLGAISTVDSGVVSHDSLLEGDTSRTNTTRAGSTGSLCSAGRSRRGEFDAVSRATLLDTKLRSSSRHRLAELRGKSPCRSHGVRSIIEHFERSPSNNASDAGPSFKTQQRTYSAPLSPLRTRILSPKHSPRGGSDSEKNGTSQEKTKSNSQLTCAVNGYDKYKPSPPIQQSQPERTLLLNGGGDHPVTETLTVTKSNSKQDVSMDSAVDCNEITLDLSKDSADIDIGTHISNGTVESLPAAEETALPETSSPAAAPEEPVKSPDDEVDRATLSKEADVKLQLNLGSIQDSPSKKDGHWFSKQTDEAQRRLLAQCEEAEHFLELELSDEVTGQIRTAIGQAHLLVNKKFKQFRGLCEKNLTQGPDEPFPTTGQDLAGFWDMVYIQVDNINELFKDLQELKANNWVPKTPPPPPSSTNSVPAHRKASTPRAQKSLDHSLAAADKVKGTDTPDGKAKARDDARKRLMAAKRAMRQRRDSESGDMIFVK